MRICGIILSVALTLSFFIFSNENVDTRILSVIAGACPCSKCQANKGKACTYGADSECSAFTYSSGQIPNIAAAHGLPEIPINEGKECVVTGDTVVDADAPDSKGPGCIGPIIGGKDCSYEQDGQSFDCGYEEDLYYCINSGTSKVVAVYYLYDGTSWSRLRNNGPLTEDELVALRKDFTVEAAEVIGYLYWACSKDEATETKTSASAPNCNISD